MSKALKAAIEANDPVAVQTAIKGVKDINRKLPGADKPLLYACEKGADKVLAELFKAGAIAEKRNTFPGETPFAVAAKFEQRQVLSELWRLKQASEQAVDFALSDAARDGRTAVYQMVLEIVRPKIPIEMFNLVSAMKKRVELTRLLLAYGGNVNVRGDKQQTPLHTAAGRGQPDVIKVLLEGGADVNARDRDGLTPLIRLADGLARSRPQELPEAVQAISILLESGADASAKDGFGTDALAHYEFECDLERSEPNAGIVEQLRKAGAVGRGITVNLFRALKANDLSAARNAIAEGADVNQMNPRGGTPLMLAKSDEAIDLLLEAGADPNRGNPLISAAGSGELSTVKKLIAAGANIHAVERSGEYMANAYSAATMNRKPEVADYLKSLGATNPKPATSEPLKPGVESWNDFSELLVKATVEQTANALAKIIQGNAHLNAYGKSFKPGQRAYVVIRAQGMDWCNVFQIAPQPERFGDSTTTETLAKELAKAAAASVLSIEYSDTSDAATVFRAEPDGKSAKDAGWDHDMLREMVEAMGDEAPEWAKKQLAGTDEDDPSSTERLEMLAAAEKFVVAAFGFGNESGREVEIDFSGYADDVFEAAAFVSN